MKILRNISKALLLAACLTTSGLSLPEGANVTHGSVNISTNGNTQTITQATNQAIVNWNGFNIDIGELVHFVQPSSVSAILNRVVGQDPSAILGSLRANGQVFLINPNGIVFGESANIDVGSLVVSTLNITDDDFLAGRLSFEQEADKELAAVINHGTIKIDENGFLVLTGPLVANDGVILAKVGQIAMAGGTKSTVSFDPTGMIQLELPTDATTAEGIVSLSQQDAGDLLSSVVNTPQVQAGELVVRDGRSYLEVESGTLVNAGEIRADGQTSENAGRILLDSTSNTILADNSLVSAAGVGENSSGGEVYVLSDGVGVSEFGSLIDVSDGGFAEQSSDSGFVGALVNTGANGTFLIDPERIVVQTGAGGGVAPTGVVFRPENLIEGRVSGTELLQTEDGVDFEALNGGALSLQNNVDLVIDLTSAAGNNGPAITFANPTDGIHMGFGGDFTLTSVAGTNAENLKVTTRDGNITVDLNGGALTGDAFLQSTNGRVTADVSGDLRLISRGFVISDRVVLGDITADNLQLSGIAGGVFLVDSLVDISNSIVSDNRNGRINGSSSGELRASSIRLESDSIGQSGRVNFSADSLHVTSDAIHMNDLENRELQTLTVVNPGLPNIVITQGGEGDILVDDGTIDANTNVDITYRFADDRVLAPFFAPGGDFTLIAEFTEFVDSDITGNVFRAENLSISAASIDLEVGNNGGNGIQGTFTGTATVGDVTVHDLSGNAMDVNFTAAGSIDINNGENTSNFGSVTGSANASQVLIEGSTIGTEGSPFVLGSNVSQLDIMLQGGDVVLQGNSPVLDIFVDHGGGNLSGFSLNNLGGNILVNSGVFSSNTQLTASGSVTTEGTGVIFGPAIALNGDSIDVRVSTSDIEANATNDVMIDIDPGLPIPVTVSGSSTSGNFTANRDSGGRQGPPRGEEGEGGEGGIGGIRTGQIDAANTITLTSPGGISRSSGSLVAPNVVLDATLNPGPGGGSVNANVQASDLTVNAFDSITLESSSPDMTLRANSDNSDIDVTHTGNISLTQVSGNEVNVQATNNASVEAEAESVSSVNIIAGNTAAFSSSSDAPLQTFQGTNLELTVGTSYSGSLSASGSVSVTANDIDLDVSASEVSTTARTGNVNVSSSDSSTLTVTDSSAAGDFTLNHAGDVEFNRIEAQNVNITTPGNITDTGNTIIASGITLNGNNVFVNTEGQVIVVNAQGDVTVNNSVVDVSSLSIDTQGNVSFDTQGNLNIASVAGGDLVSLTAGASITADSGNFVSGANVVLAVGGTITPDLNAPLNVQASDSITITAPGASFLGQGAVSSGDIAAALEGSVPVSSILVDPSSGNIFYNGVLIFPIPSPDIPPAITPPPELTNTIGQQTGEVIDDGSVGSAANDGLVEQSPTQKLVAQLTETAEGGGGGGGLKTEMLITLEVDALGEVQVTLSEPSPFDAAIDESEEMRADDILDLETGELVDVKVALYYDAGTDQLVMAVDLRADDIIDLDVSDYQLIPLNLKYSFHSDPNLILEKLRADVLFDLAVEDLGNIPIRVHVEGQGK